VANSNGNNNLAVHVRDVTKTFGKGEAATKALKGVDFDARLGELLMIVGPSGAARRPC
jgi:putative ABC transport system ATP-binding protein